MLSRNIFKRGQLLNSLVSRSFGFRPSKVMVIRGKATERQNNEDVELRGIVLKAKYHDCPNMLFFPDLLDPAENWMKFFNSQETNILDYRNVWLIYPRNFGNSDRHDSWYAEDMANDVVRFMYTNKISTATLAGHGLGAKVALAAACYHSERFTGFCGLDYSPVNYKNYEPVRELAGYIEALKNTKLNKPKSAIYHDINKVANCPKWEKVLKQNLKMIAPSQYEWAFNMKGLADNLANANENHIGSWNANYGLWGGRSSWIFPEYSRYVHLGTNTLPMHKVCPKTQGFGRDIFAIQGDENPSNHWIYEHSDLSYAVGSKLLEFLTLYDGVNTLLSDRTQLGKEFVPDRVNSRNRSDFYYTDYIPAHYRHNWRFR